MCRLIWVFVGRTCQKVRFRTLRHIWYNGYNSSRCHRGHWLHIQYGHIVNTDFVKRNLTQSNYFLSNIDQNIRIIYLNLFHTLGQYSTRDVSIGDNSHEMTNHVFLENKKKKHSKYRLLSAKRQVIPKVQSENLKAVTSQAKWKTKNKKTLGIRQIWRELGIKIQNVCLKHYNFLGYLHLLQSLLTESCPHIWAEAQHFQQVCMCAKRRLRSVFASARADQSSLSALRRFVSFTTHQMSCDNSEQTAWMHRLIWVFSGRLCNLVKNTAPRLICFCSCLRGWDHVFYTTTLCCGVPLYNGLTWCIFIQ